LNARAFAWTVLVVGVNCAAPARSVLANTAPQISGTPPTSVIAEQPYSFRPSAYDADRHTLTFSIVNQPRWATFDTATGRLQGTPSSAYSGITFAGIRIAVSDGSARRELAPFDIAVKLPNRPPVISGTPLTFVAVGKSYNFEPRASDPNSQTLSFTISNKPAWATFNTRSGRLYGAPAARFARTATSGVLICVSDGHESTCLQPFQLRVAAVNRAPSISGVPPARTGVGSLYSFKPVASDPDANALTFLIQNKPRWATFDASTGRLSGIPDTRDGGTKSTDIRIAAFDGYLKTSLPPFSIDVAHPASASDTVTLSWAPPTRNTDGSPVTNVQGYIIYYGLAADRLTHHLFVGSARATSAQIEDLPPATWYFALRTVTRDRQSMLSGVVSKQVR